MNASTARPRFKGVFPVVPTTFDERGALDLDSQRRCVDFMIDAGANGLCILANYLRTVRDLPMTNGNA